MFSTFEKIRELSDQQGLSLNKLEEKLGFSRNTIYNMKKSTPNIDRVSKIADYFNVSTDYLLGRTDNPNIASEDDKYSNQAESQLIAAFRNQTQNMTEVEKMRFNKALESLMATAKTIIDDDSKWE
ncbi:helix-turn-helix domain-containing protein [Streptococcus uberis]|uniref:helix-turn-helix domain-containing protein n=1 Tax=Streptococcus uberis TaxID=1349 RepID=UPI001939FB2C|nr:helix-turn-helix transcriptional regulator [Streptococcus uberis]